MNHLKPQLCDIILYGQDEDGVNTIQIKVSQPGDCIMLELKQKDKEQLITITAEQVEVLHAWLSTII